MQFGLFQSAQWPEGTAQQQRLFDAVEQSVLVETLGFDSVFMTEHHFARHGIVPDNHRDACLSRGADVADPAGYRSHRAAVACGKDMPAPETRSRYGHLVRTGGRKVGETSPECLSRCPSWARETYYRALMQ